MKYWIKSLVNEKPSDINIVFDHNRKIVMDRLNKYREKSQVVK